MLLAHEGVLGQLDEVGSAVAFMLDDDLLLSIAIGIKRGD